MPANNIAERLRDLASEAPPGVEVPPTLVRRARRRMVTTVAVSLCVAVALLTVFVAGFRSVTKAQPAKTPSPPASSLHVWNPVAMTFAPNGDLYVSSCALDQIYRVSSDGTMTVVANIDFRTGFLGDGRKATHAEFRCPWGLAFDRNGDLLVADLGNNRIRMIDPSGTVSTVVGSGSVGFGNGGFEGDGGPATRARLQAPTWIVFDDAGDLLVADRDNDAVREVDARGTISTLVRGAKQGGLPGGNVHSTLDDPAGIAIRPDGNVYIADSNQARVRMVDPAGRITTVAGTGTAGYSGDGGPAIEAQISNPGGLAFDDAGDLFIADTTNHVVRMVTPGGTISTIAGTGATGCPADGAAADRARLTDPYSVVIDGRGNLYIADGTCGGVYEVTSDGTIHTFARP